MMQMVEVCDVRHTLVEAVARAARLLRAGRVIAYPTDTLYALGAAADEPRGVAELLALKERPPDKAVPVLASDIEQVETCLGSLPPLGMTLARRFWPGPLTLVVTVAGASPLASGIVAADQSVAVRVPDHDVARALAAAVGAPVTSTSANRSGSAPAASAAAVVRLFGARLALVLDEGPARGTTPSTIVDVRAGVPHLLRDGAIPWSHVLESLQ